MDGNIAFYYCNEIVFNSIIEKHKIWLTSIWDLNDPSEIDWTIKKVWADVRNKTYSSLTSAQQELIRTVQNEIDTGIYRTYMYYIMSLPMMGDLLSQWRGYGDNGRGYSVGIDLDKITQSHDILWFSSIFVNSLGHFPLIYSVDEQQRILTDVFREIVEMSNEKMPLVVALMNLSRYAVKFKNPYYFEEHEVRLAFTASISNNLIKNADDNGIVEGLFAHRNAICETTHVELDLMKCNETGCIEYVVLGPRNGNSIDEIYNKMKLFGFEIKKENILYSMGMYR